MILKYDCTFHETATAHYKRPCNVVEKKERKKSVWYEKYYTFPSVFHHGPHALLAWNILWCWLSPQRSLKWDTYSHVRVIGLHTDRHIAVTINPRHTPSLSGIFKLQLQYSLYFTSFDRSTPSCFRRATHTGTDSPEVGDAWLILKKLFKAKSTVESHMKAKHKSSNHKWLSNSPFTLHLNLYLDKPRGGNEAERTTKTEIRKVEFLAVSEACKAIYSDLSRL